MKRIVSFLVAAVMVLSVFGMLHVASPIKAAAEGTNLALGKPVTEDLNGCAAMGAPYWSVNYLTDGERYDNTGYHTIYDGDGNPIGVEPDCTQYGWYITKTGSDDMNASATIDLGSVQEICRIKIFQEYHFIGLKFPNSYDIYVSADGANWTKVFSETGRTGNTTHGREVEFDKIGARYVKVTVVRGNDVVGDGNQYAGIGELEVYDTYVTGNIAANKTAKETIYDVFDGSGYAPTRFTLSGSGAWNYDAITGTSVPYAYGPYSISGWIVTSNWWSTSIRQDIDLHAVYNINQIKLVPMPWNHGNNNHGWFFPKSYDVFVSEDGVYWTRVYHGENESSVNTAATTKTINIDPVNARYISLAVFRGTTIDGSNSCWTGLGGIEVYGTFVKGVYTEKPGAMHFDASELTAWKRDNALAAPFTITNTAEGIHVQKQPDTDPGWTTYQNGDTNAYVHIALPQTVSAAEYPLYEIEAYSSSGAYVFVCYDSGWAVSNPNVVFSFPAGTSSAQVVSHNGILSFAPLAIYGDGVDLTIKTISFYRSVADFRIDYMKRGFLDYGFRNNVDFIDVDGSDYLVGSATPPTDFASAEIDGDYAQFEGWAATTSKINGVGYSVDGGEPVFDDSFVVLDTSAVISTRPDLLSANEDLYCGVGDVIYYTVPFDLKEGSHTVKLVFDIADLDDYVIIDLVPYSYTDVEYGVKTARLMLGSSLTLEAKVLFPDTVTSPKLKVVNSDNETTILEPVQTSGGFYYFDYSGIYPQKMAEEFTLTLLDGDTVFASALPTTYSVMEYADALYNATAEELGYTAAKKAALDTLLADMLTYGGAAQVYKDYDVENLADELDWVASTKTAQVPAPVSSKALLSSTEGDRIRSASIILDDVIRFVVLFKATDAEAIRFTSVAGTYTIARADWDPAGGQFTVFSSPVLAYELQNVVTVELLDGSSNVLSGITYSVESYIASGAIGTEDSYFTDALLCYGRSAYAFAQSA